MVGWRDHLTDEERARLIQIQVENRKLKDEHRRIYDRCRKRCAQIQYPTGAIDHEHN